MKSFTSSPAVTFVITKRSFPINKNMKICPEAVVEIRHDHVWNLIRSVKIPSRIHVIMCLCEEIQLSGDECQNPIILSLYVL